MPPGQPLEDDASHVPSVAILGADAMLAALPATAVQLAHACLAAGYDAVVPASWGDELVAEGCLRHLASHSLEPAVMCTCPLVAERLLGSELTPLLVPLVAPPVACARYLRALHAPTRVHLTYVGNCAAGADPALDVHLTPDELMIKLSTLGVVVTEQPLLFESVLPPDRRRFNSMPGGVPAVERLATMPTPRTFVELNGDDCRLQLAEQLLSRQPALIDLAPRMGCACSGAVQATPPCDARATVVALEPPRSASEVLDSRVHVELERPIPPQPSPARTEERAMPVDEHAARGSTLGSRRSIEEQTKHEWPVPAAGPFAPDRCPRRRVAIPHRPAARVPGARTTDGRVLPRAYLARRPAPDTPTTALQLKGATPQSNVAQWVSKPTLRRIRALVAMPPQGAVADPLTH